MAVGTWFATEFDEPAPVLDVPGVLCSGQERAFQVADQVVRGRRIVGRLAAGDGMVALKVRPPGRPLRVTVALRIDGASLDWWEERAPEAGSDTLRGRPRLVVVRAQGAPRRAVLLARDHNRVLPGDARAVASFDLGPEEVSDDGLLVIELADPTPGLPDWAAEQLAPAAGIGVRVESIEVAPVPDGEPPFRGRLDGPATQLLGIASAGGLVGAGTGCEPGPPRTPFVVVNPPSRPGDAELCCRLRLGTRAPRKLRVPPSTRWSRSLPGRALTKARRIWRRAVRRAGVPRPWRARWIPARWVTVQAIGLVDGRPVAVRAQPAAGRLEVTLPVPDAPVLVGVAVAGRRRRSRALVCDLVEVEF